MHIDGWVACTSIDWAWRPLGTFRGVLLIVWFSIFEYDISMGIMVNKRRATQLDIREQQVSSKCEVVIVGLKYQLRGTSRVFCPAAEVWTKSA